MYTRSVFCIRRPLSCPCTMLCRLSSTRRWTVTTYYTQRVRREGWHLHLHSSRSPRSVGRSSSVVGLLLHYTWYLTLSTLDFLMYILTHHATHTRMVSVCVSVHYIASPSYRCESESVARAVLDDRHCFARPRVMCTFPFWWTNIRWDTAFCS